jgi:hypothetical protein
VNKDELVPIPKKLSWDWKEMKASDRVLTTADRKGKRQIQAEDVATLARMAGIFKASAILLRVQRIPFFKLANELESFANDLDLIVQRCGGIDGK